MCDPIVFHDISSDVWEAVEEKVKAAGFNIDSDQGTIQISSVDLKWDYDPKEETLTVQCTHKALFLPCDVVYRKIEDLFQRTYSEQHRI